MEPPEWNTKITLSQDLSYTPPLPTGQACFSPLPSFWGIRPIGLLAAIVLAGCVNSPPGSESPVEVTSPTSEAVPTATNPEAVVLQVVTTITPMSQFTQAVLGDRGRVVQILPPNVGPHDFQAKPRDVEMIAQSDVLVQNGLGLEAFLGDLIRSAGNADLAIVEASTDIPTLATEDLHHAHGGDHDHGDVNPHLWLDPQRAIAQVENIREGLVAADPAGQALYEANAAAYIAALQALDQEFTQQLSPYVGQTFITFHDFASYFADRYGLQVQFFVDVPEVSPSPQDLQRIISLVKAENIRALLTEPLASSNSLAALAQDLTLEISVFDPLETGDPSPETYLKVMRQNVANLINALTPGIRQTRQ